MHAYPSWLVERSPKELMGPPPLALSALRRRTYPVSTKLEVELKASPGSKFAGLRSSRFTMYDVGLGCGLRGLGCRIWVKPWLTVEIRLNEPSWSLDIGPGEDSCSVGNDESENSE